MNFVEERLLSSEKETTLFPRRSVFLWLQVNVHMATKFQVATAGFS
jgi:hypothetical protein